MADVKDDMADDDGRFPYLPDFNSLISRCHWGQRKCLFSEMDFLTRVRDEGAVDLSKATLVYAGAVGETTGVNHIPILYSMFPTLRFVLYDMRPYDKRLFAHPTDPGLAEVHAGALDGFFDDAKCEAVVARERELGRDILFACDVRLSTDESDVLNDMLSQMRWGIALGAKYMLLKMRPPYFAADMKSPVTVSQLMLPDAIRRRVVGGKAGKGDFLYLKGDVVYQVNATLNTTETRLFVRAKKDGKYSLCKYDVQAYEERCQYYNEHTRMSKVVPDEALRLVAERVEGWDFSYEAARELKMVRRYLGSDVDVRQLMKFLTSLEAWLSGAFSRALGDCNVISMRKASTKHIENDAGYAFSTANVKVCVDSYLRMQRAAAKTRLLTATRKSKGVSRDKSVRGGRGSSRGGGDEPSPFAYYGLHGWGLNGIKDRTKDFRGKGHVADRGVSYIHECGQWDEIRRHMDAVLGHREGDAWGECEPCTVSIGFGLFLKPDVSVAMREKATYLFDQFYKNSESPSGTQWYPLKPDGKTVDGSSVASSWRYYTRPVLAGVRSDVMAKSLIRSVPVHQSAATPAGLPLEDTIPDASGSSADGIYGQMVLGTCEFQEQEVIMRSPKHFTEMWEDTKGDQSKHFTGEHWSLERNLHVVAFNASRGDILFPIMFAMTGKFVDTCTMYRTESVGTEGMEYVGFVNLPFSRVDGHRSGKEWIDFSGSTCCPSRVLFVFRRGDDRLILLSFRRRQVQWGVFVESHRVMYHELRQIKEAVDSRSSYLYLRYEEAGSQQNEVILTVSVYDLFDEKVVRDMYPTPNCAYGLVDVDLGKLLSRARLLLHKEWLRDATGVGSGSWRSVRGPASAYEPKVSGVRVGRSVLIPIYLEWEDERHFGKRQSGCLKAIYRPFNKVSKIHERYGVDDHPTRIRMSKVSGGTSANYAASMVLPIWRGRFLDWEDGVSAFRDLAVHADCVADANWYAGIQNVNTYADLVRVKSDGSEKIVGKRKISRPDFLTEFAQNLIPVVTKAIITSNVKTNILFILNNIDIYEAVKYAHGDAVNCKLALTHLTDPNVTLQLVTKFGDAYRHIGLPDADALTLAFGSESQKFDAIVHDVSNEDPYAKDWMMRQLKAAMPRLLCRGGSLIKFSHINLDGSGFDGDQFLGNFDSVKFMRNTVMPFNNPTAYVCYSGYNPLGGAVISKENALTLFIREEYNKMYNIVTGCILKAANQRSLDEKKQKSGRRKQSSTG